ncbi:hypothetical protein PG988_008072 [Apiospora saccharicola]
MAEKCGNGDFNIPSFLGMPDARQRCEVNRLSDQHEKHQRELHELDSRHERIRSLSHVDEPARQRRAEEQQYERQHLECRHAREQVCPHPWHKYPRPTLHAGYHPPSHRIADGAADTAASPSSSSTARVTKTLTKGGPEDDAEKEGRIENVDSPESLPSIHSILESDVYGDIFPPVRLGELTRFRPETAEDDRRACPSLWSPSGPPNPSHKAPLKAPSEDEWVQLWPSIWAPDSAPRNGEPRPGPGDIVPMPGTQRSLRSKKVEYRDPRPAAQQSIHEPPSITDSRHEYGRGMNNGGHNPYLMPYERVQHGHVPFHPLTALNYDGTFYQPAPGSYHGYNSLYSSPYGSAAQYDPRYGHSDGPSMLSNAAAARPPVPPQPQPQHGYYQNGREYDASAVALATPPPSSPWRTDPQH